MEGIVDGSATDTCFHCALLYPQTEAPCPRCGSRMRYRPASMMDEPALERHIRDSVAAWNAARSAPLAERRSRLLALLQTLHEYRPRSVELLAASGLTLDALRAAWEDLG